MAFPIEFSIPPPKLWQQFETLCLAICCKEYGIQNTQKWGRSGQTQKGVDIVISESESHGWIGVQCKQKGTFPQKKISEAEINDTVRKAKTFTPLLSRLIITTTAPRDEKIQALAAKITNENRESGGFMVQVKSWDDIEDFLELNVDIITQFYPSLSASVTSISTTPSFEGIVPKLQMENSIISSGDLLKEAATGYYSEELKDIRELLKNYNSTAALLQLGRLRERIWYTASDIIKYKILTSEALAHIQLAKHQDGGKKLIEALQYNPNDEKALGNCAYGYLILGDYPKSLEYVNKVLEKNPFSARAYSIYFQSKSKTSPIEEILPEIPDEVKSTQDVAGAIGFYYYYANNFAEATRWLKIALDNLIEDGLQITILLASSILNQIKMNDDFICTRKITDIQKELLLNAINLFDSAINSKSKEIGNQKMVSDLYLERGITKRILGDKNGSDDDINQSYFICPNAPHIIFFKGFSEFEKGHFPEADALFKQILLDENLSGALWGHFNIMRSTKQNDESITEISEYLKLPLTSEQENVLYHFLFANNLDKGKKFYEYTGQLAVERHENDPKSLEKLMMAIKVLQFIKDADKQDLYQKRLKELFSDSISPLQQLEIADLYCESKSYDDAIKIYESLTDLTKNTKLTQKLIDLYYLQGNHRKALDSCQKLHSIYGALPHSSQIELLIYQEVGDLKSGKDLCKRYLEKYPDDLEMRLNQAIINLRLSNTDELKSLFIDGIDINSLSYPIGKKIVNLLYVLKNYNEAISLSYELRKKYFKDPESHLDYCRLLLDIGDRSTLLIQPKTVQIDTAVEIENQYHFTGTYLIVEDLDPGTPEIQLPSDNNLAKELLGKKIGNKIKFLKAPSLIERYTVKNILSKYVFAAQDSIAHFNERFPENKGLTPIPLGSPRNGKIRTRDKKIIEKFCKQNNKVSKQILESYCQRNSTFESTATRMGIDIFSLYSQLVNNQKIGIRCCFGEWEERESAQEQLKSVKKLVLDPTALLTIHSLDIKDIILKKFGSLYIVQNTLDFMRAGLLSFEGYISNGYLTVSISEEGDLVGESISSEQIRGIKEYYEKLVSWIENNCEILPCYRALEVNMENKRKVNLVHGIASIDSLLLASEPGFILYSDDVTLQRLGRQFFGVKAAWTQVILMELLRENYLSKDQHSELIIKMMGMNYHYTSIDSSILMETAKKSCWEIKGIFSKTLETLTEGQSDIDSSIQVALNFLGLMWKNPGASNYRDLIIIKVLTIITTNRDVQLVLNIIEGHLQINPNKLSEQAISEIRGNINLWVKIFDRGDCFPSIIPN